jgi:hypothetical protein
MAKAKVTKEAPVRTKAEIVDSIKRGRPTLTVRADTMRLHLILTEELLEKIDFLADHMSVSNRSTVMRTLITKAYNEATDVG